MAVIMIEEGEMQKRITEHLAARPDLPDVIMFWHGYISALGEAGIIDTNAMLRLAALLPAHDALAVKEAMLGEEYLAEHPTREGVTEAA